MRLIKNVTIKIGEKKVRIKVFGYEKDGKFVASETWINETDLVNIGILQESSDWNEEEKE